MAYSPFNQGCENRVRPVFVELDTDLILVQSQSGSALNVGINAVGTHPS